MNAEIKNPQYESRVRETFDAQRIMHALGATLKTVEPGEVHIGIPFHDELTQQDGFLHAGIVTTIVDTACGLAALSLMPSDARVLAVEFKLNFMSPAVGASFEAMGKTIKSGRTISVCTGTVNAVAKGARKLIACMQATMMAVR